MAKDLDIEVTPTVEDAFYFLMDLEKGTPDFNEGETVEEYEKRTAPAIKAGERLAKLSYDERMGAIAVATKMIENVKKYGKPSALWP